MKWKIIVIKHILCLVVSKEKKHTHIHVNIYEYTFSII